MSLAGETFHSAAWNLSTTLGGRAVTVIGTLVLTRYLAPEAYGEVMVASTLVTTAHQVLNLGVGHYIVAKPSASRRVVFHATVFYLLSGVAIVALLLACRDHLGLLFDLPQMGRLIPGLALSLWLERMAFIPEKILIRDMRFRRLGLIRSLGELTYTLFAVVLAAAGWAGQSIVAANVARSLWRSAAIIGSAERRAWLSPYQLDRRVTAELFAFAMPMWLSNAAAFAARRWDNLLVARLFGPSAAGFYNLAYSLAEIPAIHVGEQVGDVLLPSFARASPQRRPEALLRSIGLLALLVFPMAVGLGAIAPTLVAMIFDSRWQTIAPLLTVLSVLSIAKPIAWVLVSYLQAQNRPWTTLALELFLVAMLVTSIATLGRLGLLWVCVAAGLCYVVYAAAALLIVARVDRFGWKEVVTQIGGPLAACAPMVALILAARSVMNAASMPKGFALPVEVVIGAATYAGAALLLTPHLVREANALVVQALRRREAAQR